MPETVHVVDDDEAMRDSMTFLLESAGHKVTAYTSPAILLQTLEPGTAACIVTDVRMPDMTGLELMQQLSSRNRGSAVIVITGHGDVPLAVEAMKLGAVDFLEKPFDDEVLLASIGQALHRLRGGTAEAGKAGIVERLETLSGRERQVLEALVAGKPNKIIAYDLDISPRTVEVYRANVMTKMQAGSLSELVRMALTAGVVEPSG